MLSEQSWAVFKYKVFKYFWVFKKSILNASASMYLNTVFKYIFDVFKYKVFKYFKSI